MEVLGLGRQPFAELNKTLVPDYRTLSEQIAYDVLPLFQTPRGHLAQLQRLD